jgi:hypothetical protein
MDDLRFDETEFTFGWCAICDREVLTYPEPVDGDPARRQCVHCDQLVARQMRIATGSELPSHGYGLLESQGCGNPNCGGGQCGRREAADPATVNRSPDRG